MNHVFTVLFINLKGLPCFSQLQLTAETAVKKRKWNDVMILIVQAYKKRHIEPARTYTRDLGHTNNNNNNNNNSTFGGRNGIMVGALSFQNELL